MFFADSRALTVPQAQLALQAKEALWVLQAREKSGMQCSEFNFSDQIMHWFAKVLPHSKLSALCCIFGPTRKTKSSRTAWKERTRRTSWFPWCYWVLRWSGSWCKCCSLDLFFLKVCMIFPVLRCSTDLYCLPTRGRSRWPRSKRPDCSLGTSWQCRSCWCNGWFWKKRHC